MVRKISIRDPRLRLVARILREKLPGFEKHYWYKRSFQNVVDLSAYANSPSTYLGRPLHSCKNPSKTASRDYRRTDREADL